MNMIAPFEESDDPLSCPCARGNRGLLRAPYLSQKDYTYQSADEYNASQADAAGRIPHQPSLTFLRGHTQKSKKGQACADCGYAQTGFQGNKESGSGDFRRHNTV
jgi:hypothetical protein